MPVWTWAGAGARRSSRNSASNGSRTGSRPCTDRYPPAANSRHYLDRDPLSLVRPGGPRGPVVRSADDQMDPAELVEQGEILVRWFAHPARVGMHGPHDVEIGRQHVHLEDRVPLAAHGAGGEEKFRDRARVRAEERAEFEGMHVACRPSITRRPSLGFRSFT